MSGPRGERLLAAAVRMLPPHRRELGRALLVEMSMVPLRGRRAWLIGGMWFVMRENARHTAGYAAGVLAAVAALVVVDRLGTSDDSGQVSLLVLLIGAALLGFAAPRWAWLSALFVGSALAVSGLITAILDPTAHLPKPGGPVGAATLFVLVVPALLAAYGGVGAAWFLRQGNGRRRGNSGPV